MKSDIVNIFGIEIIKKKHLVESANIVVLRAAEAGLAGATRGPNLLRLRSGLRRGAPCLQEGRGGPWRGVPTEAGRHSTSCASDSGVVV